MHRILFVIIFSAFLVLSVVPFQNVSSQTAEVSPKINAEEDSGFHSADMLRADLRLADVVAYVNVKELKTASRSDDKTDCENNTGGGYCSYLLTAEVREVYKGEVKSKTLEFYGSGEATYPKKGFMGERIVFLIWNEDGKNGEKSLGTIENSTRGADALKAMRRVVDLKTPIDETDESEPYSLKAIKKEFAEADLVVYADVLSFKRDAEDEGIEPFVLKAKVKEVFKGSLKDGQKIEYKDDLLYRPIRQADLGAQILYLEKTEENGKVVYKRIKYTFGDIQYNILEKLRKIAAAN